MCICQTGWEGPNCDICRTYPGCEQGTCEKRPDGGEKPWTCHCNEGYRYTKDTFTINNNHA